MTAPQPHTKKQLARAGRLLRDLTRERHDSSDQELWDAITLVDWWRAQHAKPLSRVNANLRYYVRKVGADPSISQRLKRFTTIVDKLRREPTMKLNTMEDIGGVRVILPTQRQVDDVVRDLRSQPRWKIRRVREYVTGRDPGPKSDGYRAVHVIVEKDGCYIEVQLRTPWQDAWAQSVEQDTRRLKAGLKFGSGPEDLRDYYRVVAEWMELRADDREAPQELLAELTKRFHATRSYYPQT